MVPDEKEDSFAAMFEREASPRGKSQKRSFRVGDRVEAVVIRVGRDAVFVELDGKQQAFLEAAEMREPDGTISVTEGEIVRANVVEVDPARSIIRLGRTLGRGTAAIAQAKESGVAIEGKVTGVNKGGLEIDLGGGTRAFCPMSQADARRIEDAEAKALIGQSLRFVVTDVRDGGKNVVVSRRALLEREAGETATRKMSDVVPGAVLRGTVTSVRDFGAFVDLGGIEGLVPRSEIAHDRSVAVADALKPGDEVEVQVREVKDAEPGAKGPSKKITLSLKALMADPWEGLDIAVGRVMLGTVTRTTEFGKFVRLAPAVEGLLHVSELGRGTKAEDGQEIRVVVKKIDRDTKKISLVPAPDDAQVGATVASSEARVGAIVKGTVERHETYGIFVQLEGTKGRAGRGLVPNAELGVPAGPISARPSPKARW